VKVRSELIIALPTLALGLLLLSGIPSIAVGAGYDRIGPRAFPYAVATGLILLAAVLIVTAVRRPSAQVSLRSDRPGGVRSKPFVIRPPMVHEGSLGFHPAAQSPRGGDPGLRRTLPGRSGRLTAPSLRTPLALLLALLTYLLVLEPFGFVAATALQFWLVTVAFRSTRWWRDGAVALVVSALLFVLFSRGLGISLP
jgi:putative tricarboxylic transport membrane protein